MRRSFAIRVNHKNNKSNNLQKICKDLSMNRINDLLWETREEGLIKQAYKQCVDSGIPSDDIKILSRTVRV